MDKEVIQNSSQVGVFGLGDFGKKLVTQLLVAECEVIVCDPLIPGPQTEELDEAIDPLCNTSTLKNEPLNQADATDILSRCDVVHWAVPSDKLVELPAVPQTCMVVLHDSVMANSVQALSQRADRDQFVLAHCLMNDSRRVLVSTEFGDHQAAIDHFENINLAPKPTTFMAHDNFMARTQGVFALIVALGIRNELDIGYENGDLTPSAIELREAVINREANWTERTLHSILMNPKLDPFVQEMVDLVAKAHMGLPLQQGESHVATN